MARLACERDHLVGTLLTFSTLPLALLSSLDATLHPAIFFTFRDQTFLQVLSS